MQSANPDRGAMDGIPALDEALRERLSTLCTEGWALWERFDAEVRDHHFHPFVAADYEVVLKALVPLRGPGLRFLEWGSATGVITIMADMLGFDAFGIELDESLVTTARGLAARFASGARFEVGSFLPTGYQWRPSHGDGRTGTLGTGPSAYLPLGHPLEDFDVVFGYPWGGEEPMMLDLMRTYGRPGARLLLHSATDGVRMYPGGHDLADPRSADP
jgi:hypothetical protein